jgi:hypothetical protein
LNASIKKTDAMVTRRILHLERLIVAKNDGVLSSHLLKHAHRFFRVVLLRKTDVRIAQDNGENDIGVDPFTHKKGNQCRTDQDQDHEILKLT